MLRSLMVRKRYDRNHPEEKRQFPILRRAFVPANHRGDPVVVLLCQYVERIGACFTHPPIEGQVWAALSDLADLGIQRRIRRASRRRAWGGV